MANQLQSPFQALTQPIMQSGKQMLAQRQETANKLQMLKQIADLEFEKTQKLEKIKYDTSFQRMQTAIEGMDPEDPQVKQIFERFGGAEGTTRAVTSGLLKPDEMFMSPQKQKEFEFKEKQWKFLLENLQTTKEKIKADIERIKAQKANYAQDAEYKKGMLRMEKCSQMIDFLKVGAPERGRKGIHTYFDETGNQVQKEYWIQEPVKATREWWDTMEAVGQEFFGLPKPKQMLPPSGLATQLLGPGGPGPAPGPTTEPVSEPAVDQSDPFGLLPIIREGEKKKKKKKTGGKIESAPEIFSQIGV